MNINEAFPAAFINAASLNGQKHTVKIESFSREEMPGGEEKPVVHFKDKGPGLILNRTNATTLSAMFGDETDSWIGKSIELRTEKVNFKGEMRDGIRVAPATETETKAAPAKTADTAFVEEDDVPF